MVIRVAVLVPGIMGSMLYYRDGPNNGDVIWSENFLANYQRIIYNPHSLHWNSNSTPAESELLNTVYDYRPRYRLWKRLRWGLQNHDDFRNTEQIWDFSYDWRQSLLRSAEALDDYLAKRAAE